MYLIEFTYFLGFIVLLYIVRPFQLKNENKWLMPIGFTIKTVIGILFLSIYLHPDTNNSVPSDTMRFLNEGKILNDVFYQSPYDYFKLLIGIKEHEELIHKYLMETFLWDSGNYTIVNDSRTVIRIHSLIHFISFGSAFIHNLFMCFIALMGVKHLFYAFNSYTKIKDSYFFLILILIPSLLFWTSGILKEPFLILGIGLLFRGLLNKGDSKKKKMFYTIIGIILLSAIKPYVLFALIPGFIYAFLNLLIPNLKVIYKLILTFLVISISSLILYKSTDKVAHYLSRKQFDFDHVGKGGIFIDYNDSSLAYFEMRDYDKITVKRKKNLLTVNQKTRIKIISKRHQFKDYYHIIKPSKKELTIVYNVGGALSYVETTPIHNSKTQLLKNIPEALTNVYLRPYISDPGSNLKYLSMLEMWGTFLLLIVSLIKHRKLDEWNWNIIVAIGLFCISLALIIGWTTPVLGAIFRYRFPIIVAIILLATFIIEPPKKIHK